MFWETLERVNRLRQEALANPEFVDSAKEHESALKSEVESTHIALKKPIKSKKVKTLAEVYEQSQFGTNPTGVQH
ncbi:hypothetical protein J4N42_07925 [Vibrio sp. SCSIO 43135]|uniref:Uncharacterized protein n=1 Tax=Vibrio paucivorans TaxID=2829489 RepID=A0A9X3HRY2_9VIBR|nr:MULTISPECIES: hypothetical protein [Vibrio]MCW8334314.1 hypothetical protein [Vibrio paucivorans]USD40007.1 hypothetical protein J4N42_07925 [Vibrio sp. SCSIO 43135]